MKIKNINKYVKYISISITGIIFLVLILIFLVVTIVQNSGEKNIVTTDLLKEKYDVIIVLGAGIKDDGKPSDILEDRLKTAIGVYNLGVSNKFLLSGDNGSFEYNEVQSMKEYIMDNCDVEEENIFLDHAGFSTYDSIYRARDIFQVKKAIIITNEYHLPRALYLAENMGINAIGVSSDIRNYLFMGSYKGREKLAQFKDFMYVNIFKPKPKFLGDIIPININNYLENKQDY